MSLKSLLLFAVSGIALAQSPNVTISDTITNPDGSHPNGTITLTWTRALNDASPRGQIVPGSTTINVVSGVVNVSLFPNGSMLPSGLCYGVSQILNGVASQYYWYVPTTTNTLTINQVQSFTGCPVPYSAIINPGQLLPGPSTGTTYLSSSSSGFVSWVPGSGGGGSSWPALTGGTNNSAQAFVVGNTSTFGYSGTGTINANQLLGTTINSLIGTGGNLTQGTGPYTNGDLASFNSGSNIIDSNVVAANVIVNTGTYANPSWITSLAASKLTGALACGSFPTLTGDVSNTNCAITVNSTGGVAFAASATTNALNASNISSGTLAAARLPAINLAASGPGGVTGNLQATNVGGGTGCSTSTWVRGDMSCQTIPSGGTVTNTFGPLTAGAVMIGNGGNDSTVLASLGTTSTVLTGNATGSPSWSQVSLTTTVSGILPGANGGTGNGYFAVSGPASSLKTFTFPNASATVLTSNAPVTLTQGGLGANFSSVALGGILSGSGAGALTLTTLGINGYVLTANSAAAGGIQWSSPTTGGTVTSIACSAPLLCTPGPITATGTISGATLVTSAASLTANQLVIGSGSQGEQTLGSLGTTTTYLQGNSGGAPSFAQVNLAGGTTGVLAAANGGSGVANTATHTLGTSNQNWAMLGTGIVKNTTTTGALTNAAASDVYGLWSGTCSSTTVLHGAGACGAVVLTTDVSGVLPAANIATALSSSTSINGTSIPASVTLTQTIASGTAAMGTSAIASGACASAVTVSASGTATTDAIIATVNGDPTSTTGYLPSASLYIWSYPTANNVNFKLCNSTGSSVTPSAITLNFRVVR